MKVKTVICNYEKMYKTSRFENGENATTNVTRKKFQSLDLTTGYVDPLDQFICQSPKQINSAKKIQSPKNNYSLDSKDLYFKTVGCESPKRKTAYISRPMPHS